MAETIPETDETETRITAITMAVACLQAAEATYATPQDAKDQVLSIADELAHWIDQGTDSIRFTIDERLSRIVQDN